MLGALALANIVEMRLRLDWARHGINRCDAILDALLRVAERHNASATETVAEFLARAVTADDGEAKMLTAAGVIRMPSPK